VKGKFIRPALQDARLERKEFDGKAGRGNRKMKGMKKKRIKKGQKIRGQKGVAKEDYG